jgi:1,6-anhydro-N-acetylmuramate kinase
MNTTSTSSRRVVGAMTGTSLDALDLAYVEITGVGLDMGVRVLECSTTDLGIVGKDLRVLAEQSPLSAGRIAVLLHAFAELHAGAIRSLISTSRVDLVCVHGQTVFHSPPQSWQLFQPAPLVAAIGCPVVFDLRAADLAHGGQGAPITPIADLVLFAHPRERRAVVNLGGFANYTLLPAVSGSPANALDLVQGGDICSCNQLLDAISRAKFNAPYDVDGQHAAQGKPDSALSALIDRLLQHQSRQERSLGTGDEMIEQLKTILPNPDISGPDLARAACSGIARAIASKLEGVDRILIAGGGLRNSVLLGALHRATPVPVESTDVCGVPSVYREAVDMAVLGALCQDGVPITLPQVTKVPAPAPLSGAWAYPTGPSPTARVSGRGGGG